MNTKISWILFLFTALVVTAGTFACSVIFPYIPVFLIPIGIALSFYIPIFCRNIISGKKGKDLFWDSFIIGSVVLLKWAIVINFIKLRIDPFSWYSVVFLSVAMPWIISLLAEEYLIKAKKVDNNNRISLFIAMVTSISGFFSFGLGAETYQIWISTIALIASVILFYTSALLAEQENEKKMEQSIENYQEIPPMKQ